MLADDSRTALAEYFRTQPHVAAAFIFGSQARGTSSPGSDLDIAILPKPGAPQDHLRALQYTNDLMNLLHRQDVDVVMLDRAPPLLLHRVARDGEVIFATSNTVVAEFVIHAVQQFEDTRPLRELQAKQASRIFHATGGGAR